MRLSVVDIVPDAGSPADAAVADFESVRPRLFGIAYQVLGGAADAEDVVQDVWVRWQGADRAQVRDRVAFLVTITTRAALNAATSAYARRESEAGGCCGAHDAARRGADRDCTSGRKRAGDAVRMPRV